MRQIIARFRPIVNGPYGLVSRLVQITSIADPRPSPLLSYTTSRIVTPFTVTP